LRFGELCDQLQVSQLAICLAKICLAKMVAQDTLSSPRSLLSPSPGDKADFSPQLPIRPGPGPPFLPPSSDSNPLSSSGSPEPPSFPHPTGAGWNLAQGCAHPREGPSPPCGHRPAPLPRGSPTPGLFLSSPARHARHANRDLLSVPSELPGRCYFYMSELNPSKLEGDTSSLIAKFKRPLSHPAASGRCN
jgi:hypothetical protein